MKAVATATMRELDRATIAGGTPGEVLMERAGVGAFVEIREFLDLLPGRHRRRLVVLAGRGNNGGDGHVVARLAARAGLDAVVLSPCAIEELSGDARLNADRLPAAVPYRHLAQLPPDREFLHDGDVIVDALLGTGISGLVRPPYGAWIDAVNRSGLPVVALDIPSGLNADTGDIAGKAVVADLTVAMGLPKAGFFLHDGPRHCGRLRCVDIGLAEECVRQAPAVLDAIFAADVRPLLTRRDAAGHKRAFGRVLVIGGSPRYAGAPMLAAEAALRTGCGLATVVVPGDIAAATRRCNALIVCAAPPAADGMFGPESMKAIRGLRREAEALVVGPGIGNADQAGHPLAEVAGWDCPVVVDADALRILARHPMLIAGRPADTVLTPHPGEMRSLLDGFGLQGMHAASRPQQACALAEKTGCHVVLKGHGTIVANPAGGWAVNSSGSNALATAGTGDVLAGLIAGFLAQKLAAHDAARLAVFVHGLAGELAIGGGRALVADDLPHLIGRAMQSVSPLA